jgi:hypothetical protein
MRPLRLEHSLQVQIPKGIGIFCLLIPEVLNPINIALSKAHASENLSLAERCVTKSAGTPRNPSELKNWVGFRQ